MTRQPSMIKRETKAMQRARQVLASKQAAWDSTMARVDKAKTEKKGESFIASKVHYLMEDDTLACGVEWLMENIGSANKYEVTCKPCLTAYADRQHTAKEETMAKRIHFLTDDDECPCGFEYDDDEQVSDDLDDVTCKKCIKAAEELEALEEEEELEEDEEDETMEKATLYTLAPATLDKPGTKSVASQWLYSDNKVPEQALREVTMPQESMVAQMQAYRLKIPYITLSKEGFTKSQKTGQVYRANHNGVAYDPIKASIELSNNNTEETPMPKKPLVTVQTTIKPQATITEVIHANMPAPSALDAILAQPIAHIMQQAPVGVPDEFLTRLAAPKRPLALPEDSTEGQIIARMQARGMHVFPIQDEIYTMFLQAFRQVLREQGLVIVPEASLPHGYGEEGVPVPAPYDPLADCLAAIEEAAAMASHVVTRAKSTLRVFTSGKQGTVKAPQAPARATGGKTDPAIIKAIQQAWNSGKVTQAALAEKYNMDDKKVWYFCNRSKQLV